MKKCPASIRRMVSIVQSSSAWNENSDRVIGLGTPGMAVTTAWRPGFAVFEVR
jgi:hypothetical protein